MSRRFRLAGVIVLGPGPSYRYRLLPKPCSLRLHRYMVTFAGAIAISSSGHAFASRNAQFRWIQKQISFGHDTTQHGTQLACQWVSDCSLALSLCRSVVLRDGCDFRTYRVGFFRPSVRPSVRPVQQALVRNRKDLSRVDKTKVFRVENLAFRRRSHAPLGDGLAILVSHHLSGFIRTRTRTPHLVAFHVGAVQRDNVWYRVQIWYRHGIAVAVAVAVIFVAVPEQEAGLVSSRKEQRRIHAVKTLQVRCLTKTFRRPEHQS
mmetsp:Transcript_18475/g.51550  ORF Transcript_18475/g.51550 Transcript_18475/m.51550 type:complete len:262 (+) Transcript_18475:91-876(+)